MKRNKKQYFLPVILATLVIVVLVLYVASKPKNQILYNQLPGVTLTDGTPPPTPKSTDVSDENGVYKNSIYGYQFEYPTSLFDEPGISSENSFARYSSDKTHLFGLESRAYKYSENDIAYPGYGLSLYFNAVDKKNGETVYQYDSKQKKLVPVGTKVSDIYIQGVKGVFYEYIEKFEDYRVGVHYYSVDFKKDDKIYYVKVVASESDLKSIRPQFEKIIKSFKFVELK